jgi:hypothetical protein
MPPPRCPNQIRQRHDRCPRRQLGRIDRQVMRTSGHTAGTVAPPFVAIARRLEAADLDQCTRAAG